MAYESITNMKSFLAGIDLSGSQLRFVRLNSSGKIVTAVSAGDCIGVLQDKPTLNQPGAVALTGSITKVVAGGAFNAGDYVMSDINGKAVSTTTGVSSMGQALAAAAADGDVVTILFQPSQIS